MAPHSAPRDPARAAPTTATTTGSAATFRMGHVPALDGIRGLAILMVMAYHILPAEAAPGPMLLRIGRAAAAVGWTGVDLFFVLSGFLITGILHDARGSRRYFLNFYGRRALRIFPLYFGFAFILIELAPAVLGFRVTEFSWRTLVTFTANAEMATGGAGMLGHYWSLAIEEQFYLAWPFVVLAMGRVALMRVCVAIMVASAACRWVAASQGVSPHMMTACRIDTLLVGALLALSARGPRGMEGWARRAVLLALAAPAIAATLQAAFGGSGSAWLQVVKYPLIAAPCAALVAIGAAAAPGSMVGRILALGPLCHLGRYSYGLYVYHQAIIDVLRWMLGRVPSPWPFDPASNFLVRSALFVGVSYAVAWASWHVLERPILSLRRYFADAPRADRQGTARDRRPVPGLSRAAG